MLQKPWVDYKSEISDAEDYPIVKRKFYSMGRNEGMVNNNSRTNPVQEKIASTSTNRTCRMNNSNRTNRVIDVEVWSHSNVSILPDGTFAQTTSNTYLIFTFFSQIQICKILTFVTTYHQLLQML